MLVSFHLGGGKNERKSSDFIYNLWEVSVTPVCPENDGRSLVNYLEWYIIVHDSKIFYLEQRTAFQNRNVYLCMKTNCIK